MWHSPGSTSSNQRPQWPPAAAAPSGEDASLMVIGSMPANSRKEDLEKMVREVLAATGFTDLAVDVFAAKRGAAGFARFPSAELGWRFLRKVNEVKFMTGSMTKPAWARPARQEGAPMPDTTKLARWSRKLREELERRQIATNTLDVLYKKKEIFFGNNRIACETGAGFKIDADGWMLESALKVINIEEIQKVCDSE